MSEKDKQQLLLQRRELETTRARERMEETTEGEKLKTQIATLQQELEHCTGDVKSVCAPYDAIVLSVSQRNAGNMVAAGTELCQLARAKSRPTVRLFLPEPACRVSGPDNRCNCASSLSLTNAMARSRPGSIGSARRRSTGSNGLTFEGRATIMPVGAQNNIKPDIGMCGEARIVVGHRTLLEQVLEPFKMLRENLRK